jgi:membrane-associated phospholipid phosphatase
MMRRFAVVVSVVAAFISVELHAQTRPSRASLIARAQIWAPTDIAARNLERGPEGPNSFAPGQTVYCDYLEKKLEGESRKFACRIPPDDEIKVKFGGMNGEVEGEVAATRLLWALGFAADRMYPVRVVCRGCPEDYGQDTGRPGERLVDPATIERKLPWREVVTGDRPGWSWAELDLIDDKAGGASKAHRDALKLLAVMLQHTDTKPEQQRLLCLDEGEPRAPLACDHPFVMLNDLGLTFGRAHLQNSNLIGSVNLEAWSKARVWKNPTGCVGNLPKSFTGTLKDPLISEEGRQFLARLLSQLSDRQLHDLFEVARVDLRPRSPVDARTAPASVDEWVRAFKQKRAEIAGRRCTEPWSAAAPFFFETGPNVWLQAHSSRSLTSAMNAISLMGFTGIYMALAVMLMFGYRLRAGAALLVLLALNAVMTDAGKIVVSYPRPDSVDSRVESLTNHTAEHLAGVFDAGESAVSVDANDGYGFPSGHVAASTAFAFGLVFLFGWRWAWTLFAAWVPLMAISRMYLGRHFLGDVLGGVAVGVIAAATALLGLTIARLENRRLAPRAARHLLVAAGALAAFALWIRLPGAYDAGRFLGVGAAVFLIVRGDVPDLVPWRVRLGRIALAALLFPATAWVTSRLLEAVGMAHEPVGALLAGALPTAMLVIGPIYLPRTLTLTRYSPVLSFK